jgi:membrane-bound hydrogenase subunit beta
MMDAQELAKVLSEKLSLPAEAIRVQRAKRIWIEAPQDRARGIIEDLVKNHDFPILCTITGLDLGADLGYIYHLAREDGLVANISTRAPKGQAIKTVTPIFPVADIYERELMDLLGAAIEGLPEGRRYPLPDDWPADQHPLLKDWQPPQQGKESEDGGQ